MKTKINWKGIFLVTLLTMGFVSSTQRDISAANTFSGFVDDNCVISGFLNWWPEWTVEQYDRWGVRHLNTPWMKKHKVIDGLGTYEGNEVRFRYAQYINTWIVGNHRDVSLTLSMYNYHGGEIKVMPAQTNVYPTDFNVYINGNFYQSVHADADKDHKIMLMLYY